MTDDHSQQALSLQAQPNALTGLVTPVMDLVGPTVDDDIRRAISRYGAEAVKGAVKQATKAKRGRKREPDWSELRETIEADARIWLMEGDPFAARTSYAIAKEFSERKQGQSVYSTHKRIERKLNKKPYDRRYFTLVSAREQSREAYSYLAHIRTLEALANLPEECHADMWRGFLERACAIVSDYEAREGNAPSADLTFAQIEEAVNKRGLNALLAPLKPRGLLGTRNTTPGLSGLLGSNAENSVK